MHVSVKQLAASHDIYIIAYREKQRYHFVLSRIWVALSEVWKRRGILYKETHQST
jgi:hypothetical protein